MPVGHPIHLLGVLEADRVEDLGAHAVELRQLEPVGFLLNLGQGMHALTGQEMVDTLQN